MANIFFICFHMCLNYLDMKDTSLFSCDCNTSYCIDIPRSRLSTACNGLLSEIATNRARIDAVKEKSREERRKVESLKTEVSRAWETVERTQGSMLCHIKKILMS